MLFSPGLAGRPAAGLLAVQGMEEDWLQRLDKPLLEGNLCLDIPHRAQGMRHWQVGMPYLLVGRPQLAVEGTPLGSVPGSDREQIVVAVVQIALVEPCIHQPGPAAVAVVVAVAVLSSIHLEIVFLNLNKIKIFLKHNFVVLCFHVCLI